MSAELLVLKSPLDYAKASRFSVELGKTLEDIVVDQTKAGSYQRGNNQSIDFIVNGRHVEGEQWPECIIQAGDQIVAMPRLKDPVSIIYIVLLAATIYYVSTIDIPGFEDSPETSPSYEADPQGNRARLGQPIPEHFGRFRVWPDYTSTPVQEIIGNDQWGFYLFTVGRGSYDIGQLKFGDTLASQFEGFEYAQYEPGQRVTLVPSASYSASEVGGSGITLFAPNEANYSGESGPFPANGSQTQATTLLFDFLLPRGLNYANSKGKLDSRSANVLVEWREIDDDGNPVDIFAGWQSQSYSYSDKTTDVLRFTETVTVPAGRYEVRARRTDESSDSYKENDELRWAGLRSYLDDDQSFDETVIAVKIKVTATLSAQAERKFNLIATRRLPVYDAVNSVWLPEQATRNPIWAMCSLIKTCGYSDANFRDLSNLAAIADLCDQRGDVFDGRFEQRSNLWDALKRILRVCRSKPVNYGNSFDAVRDGPEQRGEYQFTGRNTIKGSFGLQFKTVDEWEDHSVIVEYTNPQTWKKEEIICALPGITPRNPERIGLLDTTDQQQAYREGMYQVASRYFRNRIVNLTTELDGRVPRLYDRALVTSLLPRWGKSGDVVEQVGQELLLSEPVEWQDNTQHYMWLAADDGSNSDSFQVNRVFDADNLVVPDRVTVVEPLPSWIYTGFRKARTRFAFAAGGDQPRRMLLTGASPSADYRVSMTFAIDDPRVHQYDALVDGGTLIPPAPAEPAAPLDLLIRGVQVIQGGSVDVPEVRVSWQSVMAAQRYFVGVRYDNTSPWRRVYSGSEAHARFEVAAGDVYISIAAMADTVGPWYEHGLIDAGNEFAIPGTPSGLNLVLPFEGNLLSLAWQDDVTAASWRIDYVSGQVLYSQTVESPTAEVSAEVLLANGFGRTVLCRVYAINANAVASAVPAELNATNPQVALLQNIGSFINVNMLHINFDLPADADFAGVIVWVGPSGFDPATAFRVKQNDPDKSSIDVAITNPAWTSVRVAGFDIWGEDGLNVSPEILDVAAGLRSSDLHSTLSSRIALIDAPATGLIDQLALEIQLRTDSINQLSQEIDSNFTDNTAVIQAEEVARINADNALASQITTLVADIDSNQAAIQTESTARATADSALSTQVTTLTTNVDTNAAAIQNESTARATADSALSTQVTTLTTNVDTNAAAIQNESTARTAADGAIAADVTTLQTSVAGNTGSIQTANTAIAAVEDDVTNIKLEHYVKLDNDGYVTGFGTFNNGPGASGFIVRADSFGISHPSTPDAYPFVFDSQSGQLYVSSAYIPNLDVGILTGDIASFIQANFSTVQIGSGNVSGVLQSPNFSTGSQTGLSLNFANGQAYLYNLTASGNITANNLNAAGGTFSGTLTASAVNAVDTINIAGNSIILKQLYQSAATVSYDSTFSRSIDMTGTKGLNGVRLDFQVGFFIDVSGGESQTAGGSFGLRVRIYRGGSLLQTLRSGDFAIARNGNGTLGYGDGFFSGSYIDFSSGSGVNDYSIRADVRSENATVSVTDQRINYRQLSLEGVKV